MIPTNGKIIVSVDLEQKSKMLIGGQEFFTATKFETNYRERSPTIATVVDGNGIVNSGDILLCHHNLFYLPSPYHLGGNEYSIPFSKVIFAKIKEGGVLEPMCGNVLVERVPIKYIMEVPVEMQKTYDTIYDIINAGYTRYKAGQRIFTRPSSGYTIVYNIGGEEKRAVKVDSDMICGVLK